ncbi:Dopa 45-dioxygenase (plasmid) [Stanieria cyanosphaera PCC 7437]|uniref:Dopa 45-dioxygenase n=1 Tax=Stanieria cyanosphaera (strain ATCC 29371 / PCC 7437) TaxID=111780 RepID=K9Y1F7_STAC7|nr:DOPA 4,5-dioxygenase family protein [Stanieria cyanosphaera]AFZ38236.1 Dopa 45-dioxygenase [Stanieria cyanosphaera PCC 7437]
MEFQDISSIKGYHAHVYFDEATVEQAKALCEEAGKLFGVTVGRMHHRAIGPHPCWSCQLAFNHEQHTDLLTWLALNRNGLTVLIHPLSGNDLKDHTDYASWMGEPQALKLSVLE